MGYHTFAVGEVLTAANVNSFLMNQAVITCTSGTRPASPTAGFTIYETDTGNVSVYTGTAWVVIGVASASGGWTTYTPTWTAATTNPTNAGDLAGRYRQVGKTVHWEMYWQDSTTATLGTGAWQFALPVAPVNDGRSFRSCGSGFAKDAGGNVYTLTCVIPTASAQFFQMVVSGNAYVDATHPVAWGSTLSPLLTCSGTYEAA